MKTITRASRVNSVIQVIQHVNNRMTVMDACQEISLPRSSFYAIFKDNPEVIAEVQEMIEANSRQQPGQIFTNKTEILKKVIEVALSDSTKRKDRPVIYKDLSDMLDDLTHHFDIESQASKDAHEFPKHGQTTQHRGIPITFRDIP